MLYIYITYRMAALMYWWWTHGVFLGFFIPRFWGISAQESGWSCRSGILLDRNAFKPLLSSRILRFRLVDWSHELTIRFWWRVGGVVKIPRKFLDPMNQRLIFTWHSKRWELEVLSKCHGHFDGLWCHIRGRVSGFYGLISFPIKALVDEA